MTIYETKRLLDAPLFKPAGMFDDPGGDVENKVSDIAAIGHNEPCERLDLGNLSGLVHLSAHEVTDVTASVIVHETRNGRLSCHAYVEAARGWRDRLSDASRTARADAGMCDAMP